MNGLPENVQANWQAAQRIMQRCDALAQFSSMDDGICRTYLSQAHRQANVQVAEWMTAAGMTPCTDAAGSIRGRFGPTDTTSPVLLIGSHLDTIPNAGRYDGILGVLLAIELIARLRAESLPFAIEVLGFGEEEGVRFGTTLMTSRACAGTWNNDWLDLKDGADTSLREAFAAFGLDVQCVTDASYQNQQVIGFIEAHIEQGPVLEARQLPLAVVTSIAGARRLRLTLDGQAGHAGTMPMDLRRDALATAAQVISTVENIAIKHAVVATVGQIHCHPNAVNVVPGKTEFSIDIRSGDDARRDAALHEILEIARKTCQARHVDLTEATTHDAPAVACDNHLQQAIAAGIEATGLPVHRMESGAGHDAMALAELCPVGMLFIRCAGGISHHPDEAVTTEDVSYALTALQQTMQHLAQTYSSQEALS